MKNLVIFVILLIFFGIAMQDLPMFQKTRNGQPFEYYKTVTSDNIPPVLSKYLLDESIRYSLYRIPNYVKDLLVYNKDFESVYKSKPKYSIILLSPSNYLKSDPNNYSRFYNKIKDLQAKYKSDFNLISINNTENIKYPIKYDNQGLKGLAEHCVGFCIVDPSRDIMFTFKRISASETKALDVLFQEYSYMLH